MFGLQQSTPNANFFSTPNNTSRSTANFSFGGSNQNAALTSTPLQPTSLSTTFSLAGPTSNTFGATTAPTTNGSIHKFEPVSGTDKITKNNTQQQIRTKIFNISAMTVYEKKSMEELRFEDYSDNRKFSNLLQPIQSNITGATPAFSTSTTNLFNSNSAQQPTLNSALQNFKSVLTANVLLFQPFSFNNPMLTATTTSSSPFGLGSTTTTAPFGSPQASTTSVFAFGQPSTSTAAPLFGGTISTPSINLGSSALNSNTSAAPSTLAFNFSTPKTATATASTFTFNSGLPPTQPTLSLFAQPTTSNMFSQQQPTVPSIFSTNTAPSTNSLFSTQSQQQVATSAYTMQQQTPSQTRTQIQLFQTMLNVQPFNNELNFLAKTIKPSVNFDRNRIRTAPEQEQSQQHAPLFPSFLKPNSTLTPHNNNTNTNTTFNGLSSTTFNSSSNLTFTIGQKRKLADTFLDEIDDDATFKANASLTTPKRPRVLDMNKIRTAVLGGDNTNQEQQSISVTNGYHSNIERATTTINNKNNGLDFSNSFNTTHSTSLSVSNGWKKFATYDDYIASKQKQTPHTNGYHHHSPHRLNEEIITNGDSNHHNGTLKNGENDREDRRKQLDIISTRPDYTYESLTNEYTYDDEYKRYRIKNLKITRKNYGSIEFPGWTDVTQLNLDETVTIGWKEICAYPYEDNKPEVGLGLNKPAIVVLYRVYPSCGQRSIDGTTNQLITDPDKLLSIDYPTIIKEQTQKMNVKFIDYDIYSGTWTFQVPHF
ncbi:unnamed protein product [Didymodactylos carnosus]|uniref:Nuclear pore complex protein Nup98-Nup96 n=1 Tax=Didymodactylos carnosus TaxID=1234261 RepID=A0A8S2CSS7_9BILA|nr:unnamed protein product [Didymodactylos carnosus]CAF3537634.1 unnamed protein product [Didymodactylos carnosus]